jgi:hypothetical protein
MTRPLLQPRFGVLLLLAGALCALLVTYAPRAVAYPEAPPAPNVSPNVAPHVSAAAASTPSTAPGSLALTGADVLGLAVIGLSLVGIGVLTIGISRRRVGAGAPAGPLGPVGTRDG